MNVLVIDDCKHIRHFVSTFLGMHQIDHTCLESGKSAIELCKSESFSLILVDIRMPEMDGIETSMMLRENGVRSPIVALSSDDEERVSNQQFEFNGFLPKPIDGQVLISTVRDFLKK